MIFSRNNGRPKPIFFASNNNHYIMPTPAQQYQFNLPLQTALNSPFNEALSAFANTKNVSWLRVLEQLIYTASMQNQSQVLEYYFNSILLFDYFPTASEKSYFRIKLLSVFFRNVAKDKLPSFLMNYPGNFLELLLRLKSVLLVNLYLELLRGLLVSQQLTPQQYVNIVLDPQISGLFIQDGQALPELCANYLAKLTAVLKAGQLILSLSDYLQILMNLAPIIPLREEESELVSSSLGNLKVAYNSYQLSRELYIQELIWPDPQGLTLLHKLVLLNKPEILEIYFGMVSEVCEEGEIESLIFNQSSLGSNLLHGLALTGNMQALRMYVDFLAAQFTVVKAYDILLNQMKCFDLNGLMPCEPSVSGDTPMNHFLLLLLNDEDPAQSLAYLESDFEPDGNLESINPQPWPSFFFTSPETEYEAKKKVEELNDGEQYLPAALARKPNQSA